MDHPTSLQRDPWRITAIAASGLAAFELVLLVMLAMAFFARPLIGGGEDAPARAAIAEEPAAKTKAAPAKTEAKAAPQQPAGPKLARNETSVIVLNGNGSPGAASEKADLLQTRGYLITATENAPRSDFARSVVMFRPGYDLEAKRLAKDFGIASVAPLDGLTPADLQGAHVALIVGES